MCAFQYRQISRALYFYSYFFHLTPKRATSFSSGTTSMFTFDHGSPLHQIFIYFLEREKIPLWANARSARLKEYGIPCFVMDILYIPGRYRILSNIPQRFWQYRRTEWMWQIKRWPCSLVLFIQTRVCVAIVSHRYPQIIIYISKVDSRITVCPIYFHARSTPSCR